MDISKNQWRSTEGKEGIEILQFHAWVLKLQCDETILATHHCVRFLSFKRFQHSDNI